ncbi:uncharacterized protein LOC143449080 [Clavelina lepadiformis]|uniref:uncharacterized protein LOC143449080 n=1 Tax=Clavelina lepadiformis TaxID=159417 RepID=UPI00404233F7
MRQRSNKNKQDYFDEWPSKNQTPCYSQTMRQSRSIQQRCEFDTELSDHVSLYLSADKCERRSAIRKASTRFSSQHSAVSHFVNCRFFPTGMTCGDMAESWNAE